MFSLNEFNSDKYKILSDKIVDEQNIEVVEILHIKTCAKVLLFICDDENRVFNIAFKTPVENGKGTPHILEHSVLCGSRKYNVKEPFIELAKGSMNTFLNAMTFPDKTCYPVASANLKDFHNLMDVYLDAVFYPNAIKNDKIFKQEGWHYEIENEKDDLKVNGVVYNEMKGVYSDPDSILESAVLANLFSDTNYAYDYGGNPSEIIDLTHDEFVKFHHKFYSATNSIIYFYGKLDYNEELTTLHNNYLKDMDKVEVDARFTIPKDIRCNKERIDYYNIDIDDTNNKSYIAYSLSIPNKTNLNYIVMYILNYVLFSSDSAILKDKLLNEGYGESIEAHFEPGLKNGFYSIVAKNIDDNKKDDFIKLIKSFIKEIVDNGLDVDKFKAGINSIYFENAEGEFGRLPRGLYFSLVALDTYLYGENATTYIKYKETFDYIRSVNLGDKNNIFIETLKKVFLENNWTAINVLKPKKNYSKEKEEKLASILKDRKEKMGVDGIKNIIDDMNALRSFQKEKDSEENIKSIPMLKTSDIDRDKKIIDYTVENNEGIDTIICYDNDKDIAYNSISFEVTDFSKEEIYLCSLIYNLVTLIDLDSMTYKELNNYIDINTGGIDVKIDTFEKRCLFTLFIKSTIDKVSVAFDILHKILSGVNFKDSKRIKILLSETKNRSLLSLLSSGHVAAANRSKSLDEYSSSIADKIGITGVGFNKFINSICKAYDSNSDQINDTLHLLFKKIISKKMYWSVSVNKKYYSDLTSEFKTFANNVKSLKFAWKDEDEKKLIDSINEIKKYIPFNEFDKKVKREAIVTPNDVNFCAISGKFDKKYYSGKLSVLRTLFNYEYLWTNIRVLGGAYGCMSMFARSGNYAFISYRDPHVANTNKTFYEVFDFLKNIKKTNEEVDKYIIGSMGTYDNPMSTVDTYKKNTSAYFNEVTDLEINKQRHDVLDMKFDDFNKLADAFIDIKNASACALISENKTEEAKKEYDLVWKLQD